MVVWGWAYTRVCPCDQRRVFTDRRWKFDFDEYMNSYGERICYYERRPWWISTQVWCFLYVGPYLDILFNFCLSLSTYFSTSLLLSPSHALCLAISLSNCQSLALLLFIYLIYVSICHIYMYIYLYIYIYISILPSSYSE